MDGARDDIARREFGCAVVTRHERLAVGVDEPCAFTPQGLRGQGRRIGADIDRRRVELHELEVADHRPRPEGLRDRRAPRLPRVGGDPEQTADTTAGEHRLAGAYSPIAARPTDERTGDHAIVLEQCDGTDPLEQGDVLGTAHRARQRAHDRSACEIASHTHHTGLRMCCLLRQGEAAIGLPIEGHAERKQIVDPRRRILGEQRRDFRVYQACTRRDRVRCVEGDAIPAAKRRGHATLRPSTGRSLPERCRRQYDAGTRRQAQRERQPGEPRPDDQDVRLERVRHAADITVTSTGSRPVAKSAGRAARGRDSMRSIATRALTATSSGTTTSWRSRRSES